MIESHGTWMTKGKRVDASSIYNIPESVSKENDENGERERRISGYWWQMYNRENESSTSYHNNTPFEDLYHRDNIKAPPGPPR